MFSLKLTKLCDRPQASRYDSLQVGLIRRANPAPMTAFTVYNVAGDSITRCGRRRRENKIWTCRRRSFTLNCRYACCAILLVLRRIPCCHSDTTDLSVAERSSQIRDGNEACRNPASTPATPKGKKNSPMKQPFEEEPLLVE